VRQDRNEDKNEDRNDGVPFPVEALQIPPHLNITGKYILDGQGNPVEEPDVLTWGRWMEDDDHIQLRFDVVKRLWRTPVTVSTVFLGLDCNTNRLLLRAARAMGQAAEDFPPFDDRPILWETMVFGGKFDRMKRRYRTREDAVRGHRMTLFVVRHAESLRFAAWRWWMRLTKRGDELKESQDVNDVNDG